MHGSWGNLIKAEEAFEQMGADVMRWQFCAQPPDRNLLFGYGPAHEVQAQAAHALELGQVPRRLREHRGLPAGVRGSRRAARTATCSRSTAGSWRAPNLLVAECTAALEAQLTHRLVEAFEAYVDDLSNWYIRRSRRRFYGDDEAAFRTLWFGARAGAARGRAGDAVPHRAPVAEPRARASRARRSRCISRGGRRRPRLDEALLAEVAEVRRVVALGHQARAQAGVKLRQPLARLRFDGAPLADDAPRGDRGRAAREGRRRAGFPEARARVKPNLRCSGRSSASGSREVQAAMRAGEVEQLPDGGCARARPRALGRTR